MIGTSAFPHVDYTAWREAAERDLKGRDFERALVRRTLSGLHVQPLYTEGPGVGYPGPDSPTRAMTPLGRSQHGWTIVSQPTGPDVVTAAAEVAEDLAEGARAVWLRFDAAGRRGLDPDEAAPFLIGRGGLAMHAAADLEQLLALADPGQVAVELDAGAAFGAAAALLSATWRAQRVDPERARGCFGADPLGHLAADGELPGTLTSGLEALGLLGRWTAETWPGVAAVRVDTAAYHDAGADDATELALAAGTGLVYLRALNDAGLTVEQALRQLTFSLSLGCDLLPGVAKLRALRRIWTRIQRELGAAGPCRIHARTSRRMLTRRDPWVNALRVTLATIAAAQGGADAISAAPLDVARGLPTARARRLARTTQLILRDESHLHRVVDPWGGAYAVEALTESLAEAAWRLLQELETRGGAHQALEDGWVHAHVDASHQLRLREVATRRRPLTGVSEFPDLHEDLEPQPQVDMTDLITSAARTVRARRQARPLTRDAAGLADSAAGGATLGQLAGAAWKGMPARVPALGLRRPAEPFEYLRDRSDAFLRVRGRRPQVFLASMGRLASHTGRTTWITNLLAAGGIEALSCDGYADPQAAAVALRDSGCEVAIVCGSDRTYVQTVEALAPALRVAGAQHVWLAGKPGEHDAAWRAAGVDGFVHMGVDVLACLRRLHEALEVPA